MEKPDVSWTAGFVWSLLSQKNVEDKRQSSTILSEVIWCEKIEFSWGTVTDVWGARLKSWMYWKRDYNNGDRRQYKNISGELDLNWRWHGKTDVGWTTGFVWSWLG